MGLPNSKFKPKTALFAVASTLALLSSPVAVQAQDNASVQQLVIEGGPLADALIELSELLEISVIAPDRIVRGKVTAGVSGARSAEEALALLLNGTGLEATPRGDAFLIKEMQTPPASSITTNATEVSQYIETPPIEPLIQDAIIVAGTKQNLSVQDTQTSVALITGEQAEERGLFNLEDFILRTPNLSTAGGSLNDISIRGISFFGVGGAGSGVTGNIYVDGAPSSSVTNGGALNLWDVEQVEALRGPQSTVQGRNALAGAIVFETADPEYDFGADARIIIGNENSRQYSGAVTGPIIADQVAFRLSADYREVDFEVINQLDGRDTRLQEGLTLRGKLLFEPKALEDLRVEITGEYISTDTADLNSVSAPVPISDPAFGDFDPFGNESFAGRTNITNIETTRFIADLDYQVNDHWSVKVLGTYEEGDSEIDLGDSNFDFNVAETYTAELRANFEYDSITGWLGGYVFDSSLDTTRLQEVAIPLPVVPTDSRLNLVADVSGFTENYAVFGNVTYTLTDKLTIDVGARYDWESLEFPGLIGTLTVAPSDCIIAPFIPEIGGRPCAEPFLGLFGDGVRSDTSFEAFLPRGTVIYDFNDDQSISLSVSRGYRAGGVAFTTASNGAPIINQYDPEYLTSYELAFRNEWPDAGITLNANIFYSDWRDQQVELPGEAGNLVERFILNSGESELFGAEFAAQAEITKTLSVFANMGLLWTEFTDFPFAVDENGDPQNPADPQFANLDGNRFNNAPRFNAAAGVTYQDDQGLFANTNISYSSAQFSDILNLQENRGDEAFLVNARVGYDFGSFKVAAFVDNLFDDRVVLGRTTFTVPANTGVLVENANPRFTVNEPRLFGVELRTSF